MKARVRKGPHRIPPELLRGRSFRPGPHIRGAPIPYEVSLLSDVDVRGARIVALDEDLEVAAAERYRVFLRNVATGTEQDLGLSPVTAQAIADGRYMVRIEYQGRFWRRLRARTEFPLEIASGAILIPLPEVRGLTAVIVGATAFVSWTYESQPGTLEPYDFALWTSATLPVSTAGAPVATVISQGVGSYTLTIAAPTSPVYVGVAARGVP